MNKEALATFESIRTRFGLESADGQIASIRRLTSRNATVDVAVFGRFKSGKSSFLNYLIGEELLPTGVLPVTAVVTTIRYGPTSMLRIHHLEGSVHQEEIRAIRRYVMESENPKNEKRIKEVELVLPSLKRFEWLRFVDTPGLGSTFEHNTDTSLSWLPETGCALVAISVDPPISSQDLALIKKLSKFTPRIAILLTKADLVDAADLTTLEKFIIEEIRVRLGLEIKVFPFSNKAHAPALLEELIHAFLTPLMRNKDQEVESIAAHKIHSLAEEFKGYLKIAREAARRDEAERALLKSRILAEKADLGIYRKEILSHASDLKSKTRPALIEHYDLLKAGLESKIRNSFDTESRLWKGNLWKNSRAFEEWLERTLGEKMALQSENDSELQDSMLGEAAIEFERISEHFSLNVSERVRSVLGFELRVAKLSLNRLPVGTPDIGWVHSFDIHFDLLWFLIPMAIFRPIILKHQRHLISREVEKSFSRLASQLAEIINKEIDVFSVEALKWIEGQIFTLSKLLEQSASDSAGIETAIKELDVILAAKSEG